MNLPPSIAHQAREWPKLPRPNGLQLYVQAGYLSSETGLVTQDVLRELDAFFDLLPRWRATGNANRTKREGEERAALDWMFRSVVFFLGRNLTAALKKLICDEAENALDDTLIPPWEVTALVNRCRHETEFRELLVGEPRSPEEVEGVLQHWEEPPDGPGRRPGAWWPRLRTKWARPPSYGALMDLYAAEFWPKHAPSYGGALWHEITRESMELHGLFKNGRDFNEFVGQIDKVCALRHNTGTVLEKLRRAMRRL